jgi:8-oxo-dGTP diphosphatase
MNAIPIRVKVVMFTIQERSLCVYFPADILPYGELTSSADAIAKDILDTCIKKDQTNIFIEQLYTFSNPAKKEVDIVYYALVPSSPIQDIHDWKTVKSVRSGHTDNEIIDYALQRLRWKVEYTNIVYSLLPLEFTLSELQQTYEAILGRELDKRNFRKKILSLQMLTRGQNKKTGLKARPAAMYSFSQKKMVMVKVF